MYLSFESIVADYVLRKQIVPMPAMRPPGRRIKPITGDTDAHATTGREGRMVVKEDEHGIFHYFIFLFNACAIILFLVNNYCQ